MASEDPRNRDGFRWFMVRATSAIRARPSTERWSLASIIRMTAANLVNPSAFAVTSGSRSKDARSGPGGPGTEGPRRRTGPRWSYLRFRQTATAEVPPDHPRGLHAPPALHDRGAGLHLPPEPAARVRMIGTLKQPRRPRTRRSTARSPIFPADRPHRSGCHCACRRAQRSAPTWRVPPDPRVSQHIASCTRAVADARGSAEGRILGRLP